MKKTITLLSTCLLMFLTNCTMHDPENCAHKKGWTTTDTSKAIGSTPENKLVSFGSLSSQDSIRLKKCRFHQSIRKAYALADTNAHYEPTTTLRWLYSPPSGNGLIAVSEIVGPLRFHDTCPIPLELTEYLTPKGFSWLDKNSQMHSWIPSGGGIPIISPRNPNNISGWTTLEL